ncbi:DUF4124 domain-containing protein [Thiopseudomonas alkaliphila]|uniref:DUF4124 domain-containing protein n=1 Tax=Thiopseudomonas alkaliphila TaxID=1697053 RepID=UPI0025779061|nr:DUF4124 domain-containing protein [Thiopseudomonas alkaliphila]MDM1707484.1 DUF4124 domain-containing protein [Thiopseudomonas alkaliphila]
MRQFIATSSLIIGLMAPFSPASATDIYRWVDNAGVLHYGAQPPANYAAELVVSGSYNTPKAEAPAQQASPIQQVDTEQQQLLNQQVKKQVEAEAEKRKKYCATVRQNLAQLENNPRLMSQEETGEVRRLTEEERQARIAETRQSISEHCTSAGL